MKNKLAVRIFLVLIFCFTAWRFLFFNPAGIELLKKNGNVRTSSFFKEAAVDFFKHRDAKAGKPVFFIYINQISMTCAEGAIMTWLNNIQKKYDDFLDIIIFLPQEYSENDLKNVSAYFPSLQHFYRINDSLQEKVEIYRQKPDRHFISGYSFFTDQNGRVLNVTHFIHPFYSVQEQAAKITGFLENMLDDAPKK